MLAERIKKWPEQWEERGRQEGRRETLEEAEQRVREAEQRALEEKCATVRHLLAFSVLSDGQIAEATGLSVDEIAKLRMEDKH